MRKTTCATVAAAVAIAALVALPIGPSAFAATPTIPTIPVFPISPAPLPVLPNAPLTLNPSQPATPSSADITKTSAVLGTSSVDVNATIGKIAGDAGRSSGLGSGDPTQSITGLMSWSGLDGFVDVNDNSAHIYLGVLPVVNGQIDLSNLSQSGLGSKLVVRGRTTGTVITVVITIGLTTTPTVPPIPPVIIPAPVADPAPVAEPAKPVTGVAHFAG